MLEKRLQELLEFAKTTDLQELLWEKDGATVHFRRQAGIGATQVVVDGRPLPGNHLTGFQSNKTYEVLVRLPA